MIIIVIFGILVSMIYCNEGTPSTILGFIMGCFLGLAIAYVIPHDIERVIDDEYEVFTIDSYRINGDITTHNKIIFVYVDLDGEYRIGIVDKDFASINYNSETNVGQRYHYIATNSWRNIFSICLKCNITHWNLYTTESEN